MPEPRLRLAGQIVLACLEAAAEFTFGVLLGLTNVAVADLAPNTAWRTAAWVALIIFDACVIGLMGWSAGRIHDRRGRRA